MKNLVVGLVSILLMSGCASLISSDVQSIKVTSSNNKPVKVTIDDKTVVTPSRVIVIRDGTDKKVESSAEGCDNNTLIKKTITPSFFANLISWGLLGSTTDAATGKMWNYEDSVVVNCTTN